METYALALSYAIPGFVALIIIESIASRLMGMKVNYGMDTISSLSSGMTNTLKSLLKLSVVIISYDWMVDRIALMEMESSIWVYLICFVGLDFASYWSHRFNHVINIFWNRHIVHHSSEEFNLACALRQSISDLVGIYFFLYIPIALIGVPANVVAIVAPIHLFAQFWYHTRLIGRMGFLEHIIVTPSHHRVHHAINDEYIDKNYAAIFIVWDKWFGTFQEELDDVEPIYGTKKPAGTWNPVLINFMHAWGILKDAWRTKSWWDKIRIWYMPTGWRPDDVQEKYPIHVYGGEEVFQRPKYQPLTSQGLQIWSWAQLIINNLLLYHMLVQVGDYAFTDILWYSGFLFLSIFSYTTLMDHHWLAIPVEAAKMLLGLGLMYQMNGWFGAETYLAGANWIMGGYLVVSMLLTLVFSFQKRRETVRGALG